MAAGTMERYQPMEMGGPQDSMGGPPGYDAHASQNMMQQQYPSGAAMTTFNGQPGGGAGQTLAYGGPGSGTEMHGGGHESAHGGSHEHAPGIDKETGIAPRRCTDIQCCFGWLVFVVTLLTFLMMSRWYGNVEALTHGRDYYGRICGVDAGVENMPWLFWCRADPASTGLPASLQMTYPSCVPACPSSYNVSNTIGCLRQAEVVPGLIPPGQFGNVKTQIVRFQESLVYTAPYPTRPRGGRFCIPTDGPLRLSLLEDWSALHPMGRIMRMVSAGTLGNLKWIFFIVAVTAVGLGYFFFFCIKHCPKMLHYLFVYPAAIASAIGAIWLLLAVFVLVNKDMGFSQTYMSKLNPLYQHYTWVTATQMSLVGCAFVTLITMMLVGMALNYDGAAVGDLINAGMGCMKEVPGMYWLPIAEALVKWLIFIFFVDGLRWFFTVGDVHKNRIHVNGARFAGLSRDWNWNRCWIIVVIVWIIGFMWMMEIANSFFQYLISKGTVAWYFTPKENHKKKMSGSPLPGGVKDAILYHWGSIAYGAFWIPTWRPTRILYWLTSFFGGTSAPTTFVGRMFGCLETITCGCFGLKPCCGQCMSGLKEQVESGDACIKDGFTDIVIRANDFPAASQKAHMLLEHSHKVVQYMYRDLSQTTICVLGVSGIATICAAVSFLIVNFAKIYTEPSSSTYIANPTLVVALSWVLAAYIAFGFMSTWDHTADTLLYCYAWNRKVSRPSVDKYIPESVRAIVGYDDKEDDRYPYYGRAKTNMYLRSWIPIPGKKDKAKPEPPKAPLPPQTPQASWFNAGSWMGSQPPMPAPPGSYQEVQSLLPR